MSSASTSSSTHRRLAVAAALTLLGALCAAVLAAGPEAAAAKKARVLGKTSSTPEPSCPKGRCEAVGSVTGFQIRAGDEKSPFKVRKDSHLVGWSVDLSRPNKSQRQFFGGTFSNQRFGTAPAARISVLKPKGKTKFKLKSHSPPIRLKEHLGETPIFTLGKPLRVKRGDVVALTVPTWASDFAVELSRTNVWRASRDPDECDTSKMKNVNASKPHQKVGTTRAYGCRYRTARLLYWGYAVA